MQLLQVTPKEFVGYRERSSRPEFLSPMTVADFADYVCYKVVDLDAGFAIGQRNGKFGELVAFHSNGGHHLGRSLVQAAIRLGAKRLDCFECYLPKLYASAGFRITSRIPFCSEFAPVGWKYELYGTPDVVEMRLPA